MNRSQGQGLVEFALLLPVLLLLLFALFDFGRAIFAFNTVSNAAREGARIAIVDQTVVSGVPVAATEAANQATALGLDPSDVNDVQVQYLMPSLSATCPQRGLGCVAEVRVQYQFQAITPVIGSLIGPITLSSVTQIPIENTKP
jgi:Flp pilus assembly protein TadG